MKTPVPVGSLKYYETKLPSRTFYFETFIFLATIYLKYIYLIAYFYLSINFI